MIVASSVHKKENPLALLGQYSDDEEEDEVATDQPNGETKGSPTDASAEVIHDHGDVTGDNGDADSELPASVSVQQEVSQADDVKNITENVAEEFTIAPEPTLENECVTATEAVPDSSGMQIVGDIGGNWKAIMHEQSNQCYYWNTVTGETSWEIPNGLASVVAADGVTSASVPTHMGYSVEAQAHVLPHSNVEAYPSDVSVGNGTATYTAMGTYTHDPYAYTGAVASHGRVDIDPLQLAKYGEDLLQRLKLLERPHVAIDSLELIKREIEIRIADCNTLSSYGSSLLPLWLHAEVHLKQLELSVSKFEASYTTKHGYLETVDAGHKAPNEAEVMAPSEGEHLKVDVSTLGIGTGDENIKVEEPCTTLSVQNSQGVAAAILRVESDSDEDMDVEMEVDEEGVEEQGGSTSMPNKEHPSSEQVRSPALSSLEDSAPPQDNDIPPPPPPPEEEWIPPPPPENEPAPPPPPEPEEHAVSFVHADTLPQPYGDQANLGYMLPGMEYYPAAGTDGTNANYYMQASDFHILQSQQHSYYAPLSASGVSIPVETTSIPPVPGSYYSYPSVTMAATEVAAESSGYYASSTSAISSGELDNKTSSASLVANSNVNPVESDKVISKEPTVASLSQSVEAVSASGPTVHGSSTQASTSTTNQTKVPRTKKRPVAVASSLRSNKKVSSLVDKWKAAKEELRDEEEEEPEDALEYLERKRRKEIDGWRKQQIASGEAKENANFVPLGGDWRDRVKRKRAEAKKEAKTESIRAAAEQHKGEPDLSELSKGLPSGWQAYIDESTKQVYYGNNLTSETTWDRPSK
ncbi:formin-binding protein 4-like isoform X2 [Triticum dicoccoides]|uniref:formin-binding protein 4-like isoform X2 n=1 Tax=Triticum dicoccoides TaxID=85692 RepID=UPI001891C13B|nr:formin-binding protein 4-like isoform X2 [Triticum dicoccoides]